MEPSIEQMNIALAAFEGYRLHTQVHLQDWDIFRGEPDPEDKVADVVSLHEVLQYKDNEAPEHWGLPKVVNQCETEVIPVADLDYHTNWNSLMRVVEKIEGMGFSVNTITTDARIGVNYRVIINANVDSPYNLHQFLEKETKIGSLHEAVYLFTQFIKTQQQ